jgi:hypothetical protein
MILLIDDMRDIKGADIIVRNFDAAKRILQNMDFDQIWLDHDLGEIEENRNGYTLLKWYLSDYSADTAKIIQLVTANPVGYTNMENLLLSHGYEKVGSCTYSYKEKNVMNDDEWIYFSDKLPNTNTIDLIWYTDWIPTIDKSVSIEHFVVEGVYTLLTKDDCIIESDNLDSLNNLVQWRPSI